MSKRKMSAAQAAALKIRQTIAQIIQKEMVPRHGVGYRISELVCKARELLNTRDLTARKMLKAIQAWFDEKIARFNNRHLVLTPKRLPEFAKLATA